MKKQPGTSEAAVVARLQRIAVLFHEGDRHRDPSDYIVHHLAECWREDGHHVDYVYGIRRHVQADVVLVHVNLSVVPSEYLEFAAQYPIALNARIRDIRKSTFSRNLVRPGDPWDGPVIVKSDLNYAGVPERYLSMTALEHRLHGLRRFRKRIDRLRRRKLPFSGPRDYRIFDRIGDVPDHWFADHDVIVEKFRPEIENGLYHTRVYQFLGDRSTCTRIGTVNPIVKADRNARTESIEPDDRVVEWRKSLGLDYGKLDYVINDGEAVLLDVNKTTGASRHMNDARLRRMRRYQAEGLYAYFS